MTSGKYERLTYSTTIQTNIGNITIKQLIKLVKKGLVKIEVLLDQAEDYDAVEVKDNDDKIIIIGKKVIFRG